MASFVFDTAKRFIRVEALGDIALLGGTAAALLRIEPRFGDSYQNSWYASLSIGVGAWTVTHPLHFWSNDGLRIIFFLVVGSEILVGWERRGSHIAHTGPSV